MAAMTSRTERHRDSCPATTGVCVTPSEVYAALGSLSQMLAMLPQASKDQPSGLRRSTRSLSRLASSLNLDDDIPSRRGGLGHGNPITNDSEIEVSGPQCTVGPAPTRTSCLDSPSFPPGCGGTRRRETGERSAGE